VSNTQEQEQDLLNKLYDYIKELGGELEPGCVLRARMRGVVCGVLVHAHLFMRTCPSTCTCVCLFAQHGRE